jgi:hypothetical protein
MANVKPEIDQLELQQNDAVNDIEKRLEPVESNVDVLKPGIVNEVRTFKPF